MTVNSVIVNSSTVPVRVADSLPAGTTFVNNDPQATVWMGNSASVTTNFGIPITPGGSVQTSQDGPVYLVLDNNFSTLTVSVVYSTLATILTNPPVQAPQDSLSSTQHISSSDFPATGYPATITRTLIGAAQTYGPSILAVCSQFQAYNYYPYSTNQVAVYSINYPSISYSIQIMTLTVYATNNTGQLNPVNITTKSNTTLSNLPRVPYNVTVSLTLSLRPQVGGNYGDISNFNVSLVPLN